METTVIELIKPAGIHTRGKSSNFLKLASERLQAGGMEGSKARTSILTEKGKIPRKIDLITKEYNLEDKEKVLEVIRTYNILRSKGYPVPGTTRYYEEDGKIYLVMSDMTERGKYKIWGWSNEMTHEQLKELRSMNLSKADIDMIKVCTNNIADKATKDNFSVLIHNYHSRKNVQTGNIDVVLLDVDARMLQKPPQMNKNLYSEFNDLNKVIADFFINRLKLEMGSR